MADLFATYYYHPRADTTPESAAQALAEEETTGTWTDISTTTDYIRRLDGVVESVEPHGTGYVTRIRYPVEIFEPGNIAQYLSVFAGNLFGLGRLETVRLLDVEFPDTLVAPFHGPKFGMEGVRRLVGTTKRPHVGTIIKPKVGLTPEDTARVAYEAAIGGVDLIKDDETLTNQAFCPLADRVAAVMARLDEAQSETGRHVLYAVNVSTRADRILERAESALEQGANMLMVDVLTSGFDAIRALAEDPSVRVPLHIHRTMHAAMTRNPEHGIAMRPLARLVRMVGGDRLPHGHGVGQDGAHLRRRDPGRQRGPALPLLRPEAGLPGLVGRPAPGQGGGRTRGARHGPRAPGRRRESTGTPTALRPAPARCGRPSTRSWRGYRPRSTRRTTTSSSRRSGSGGPRRRGPEASAPR